ncbi:MAG: pyridoxal phosphate-dependent aminotransferase [Cyanobacteria bacterium HKST-UBA06]|nr:pyridoxal phosphate-dependent aminotransferase [Cyanobacteria bacterium HKST-UBA06]
MADCVQFGNAMGSGPQIVIPRQARVFASSAIHSITELALRHGAVNLGQGTPDDEHPQRLRDELAASAQADRSRYTAIQGMPALRQALADNFNRELNPALPYQPDDIMVTQGATEAFFIAINSTVGPDDEVVTTDPYYGLYTGSLQMAFGGDDKIERQLKPFPLKLEPLTEGDYAGQPHFVFDMDAFANTLTEKTKAVVLFNPHNPTGAVLNASQLKRMGHILDDWEFGHPGQHIMVIADETYRHILFDGRPHVSVAAEPSLQKRLIYINTLAKTFNTTGYRIGSLALPPTPPGACRDVQDAKAEWMRNLKGLKNVTSMCSPEPIQAMAVVALNQMATPDYYQSLHERYGARRRKMLDHLSRSPFAGHYAVPDGGYFVMVDIGPTLDRLRPEVKTQYQINDADSFVRNFLIPQIKVAAIPGNGLFRDQQQGGRYIRLSFCQNDDTIEAAFRNLEALSAYLTPAA